MDVEEVLLPAPVVPLEAAGVELMLEVPLLADVESIEPEAAPEAEPLSVLLEVVVDDVEAPVVSVLAVEELAP